MRRYAAAIALACALGPFAGVVEGAPAASIHRAAVVVEGGGETHRVVVEFPEDSITGLELLRRAGADPVVSTYSGIGGAVCRLFGVGRDAGPDCLGGTDGDARYWAYFRAPAGTSSFRYAAAGAGATSVRDGDVEGWRFGTGAAPTYASIDAILGIAAPSTTASTTTTTVIGSVAPAPGGVDAPPGAAPGDPGPGAAEVPSGSTGPELDGPGGRVEGAPIAARPAVARRAEPAPRGGRGPQSLVILALGLGGLGAAVVWARRSRRAAGAR